MFNADFLANFLVWRAINRAGAQILIVALCAIAFSVVCAMLGVWLPMILLVIAGFLIFLGVRRIFRRQPTLEEILAQPLPQGRREPRLYPAVVTTGNGLRATTDARWPVSR
jgi:membrane protein implicated in regulation of membrane protease activity